MSIAEKRNDNVEGVPSIRLSIVLLFAVVGPPVGGLTILMSRALLQVHSTSDLGMAAPSIIELGGVVLFFFSYLLGFVPATVAGFLFAAVEARRGPIGLRIAIVIGLLVGVGFAALLMLMVFLSDNLIVPYKFSLSALALPMLTCLVPTLVCWSIVRRSVLFAQQANETEL